MLIDLPFFENLIITGIRLMLNWEIHLGSWGHLLHVRSPRSLSVALLDRADDPSSRAMALGGLTHLAIDVVFHRAIEERVWALADGGRGPNTLHKHVEDQMDLHVHHHILGHSGLGTAYARDRLRLRPHRAWRKRLRQAMVEIHGKAPSAWRLERWLKSLSLFGLVNSSPRFPWTKTRTDDTLNLSKEAIPLAEEAINGASRYIELGVAYLLKLKAQEFLAAGAFLFVIF